MMQKNLNIYEKEITKLPADGIFIFDINSHYDKIKSLDKFQYKDTGELKYNGRTYVVDLNCKLPKVMAQLVSLFKLSKSLTSWKFYISDKIDSEKLARALKSMSNDWTNNIYISKEFHDKYFT